MSEAKIGKEPWNKGYRLTNEHKKAISISKVGEPTEEMIEDIIKGISRKRFTEKHGHVGIWVRIKKELKQKETI